MVYLCLSLWMVYQPVPWMPLGTLPETNRSHLKIMDGWVRWISLWGPEGNNLRKNHPSHNKPNGPPFWHGPNKSNPTPRIAIWSCQQDISTCTKTSPRGVKLTANAPGKWMVERFDPHFRRQIEGGYQVFIYSLQPEITWRKTRSFLRRLVKVWNGNQWNHWNHQHIKQNKPCNLCVSKNQRKTRL